VTTGSTSYVDINASLTLPHIKISAQKLEEVQESDLRDLELGFAFLSEVPINQSVCVADMSLLGHSSLSGILTVHDSIEKYHWWPPKPTCRPALSRPLTPIYTVVKSKSSGGSPASTVARKSANQDGNKSCE
jgi:hypothetical protein